MRGSAASSYVPRQTLCTGETIAIQNYFTHVVRIQNNIAAFSITEFIPECVHYLLEELVLNLWQEVGLPAQASI